jgi:internalin A
MAAVFAFGKRGANNRAPVSNYLISKGFEFDGVKVGHEEVLELRKLKKFIMNPRTSGRLGPVPREILSEGNENCLDRLRDYFDSLSGEVSGVTNVKLFIYGNGEVGKTQLLRCLCPPIEGPTFDVRASTTHGVNVKSFSLSAGVALPRSALGVADSTNIKVRAWDFGGQDLYHGVHSLFLKDRAIHLVAWTPSREGGSSRDSLGYKTANHPLQYCLSFARHRRGDASALIVVQTQADNADDDYKWTPR